jgi:hypothetical protein
MGKLFSVNYAEKPAFAESRPFGQVIHTLV